MQAPRFRIRDVLVLTMVGAVVSLFAKWQYDQYLVDSHYDALERRVFEGPTKMPLSEFDAEMRRLMADQAKAIQEGTETESTNENEAP